MKTRVNIITALLLQLFTIISGLILPRLFINTFGSSVNGLITSITQFLSFITLLEGGLGAVVLAELYKPLEQKNSILIIQILNACESFFKKISKIFLLYTLFLMIIYPVFFNDDFSFSYISSLILILSITTMIQYFFSITYKLLLQADQKLYICNIVSIIITFINLISAICLIKLFPNIHIVKLGSSIIYLIQPLVFTKYIKKHYDLKRNVKENTTLLQNRWSGFSQNLAYFINMNTSVVLITFFINFKEVSVYSVYMLALNALRTIISTTSNSYQSALGKYIAIGDKNILRKKFAKFESIIWCVSSILFGCCLLLINPFVELYTIGINDVNYSRPNFALIMVLCQFLYCVREPYRSVVLAGGMFKETNFGALIEAVINITISTFLVFFLGIEGVAIGMFVAVFYRLIYFILFLKENLIEIKIKHTAKLFLISFLFFLVNIILYENFDFEIINLLSFLFYGIVVMFIELFVYIVINSVFQTFVKLCKTKTSS